MASVSSGDGGGRGEADLRRGYPQGVGRAVARHDEIHAVDVGQGEAGNGLAEDVPGGVEGAHDQAAARRQRPVREGVATVGGGGRLAHRQLVAAVAGDAAHGDAAGGGPGVVGEPSAQCTEVGGRLSQRDIIAAHIDLKLAILELHNPGSFLM